MVNLNILFQPPSIAASTLILVFAAKVTALGRASGSIENVVLDGPFPVSHAEGRPDEALISGSGIPPPAKGLIHWHLSAS
jgi:hypothetical protein